jgi:hypothetical protein
MRLFFIVLFLLGLVSCAQNPKEQVAEAIDIALSHLSDGDCDKALDALEEVKEGKENPIYLQVLASAHACKASFNEISFVATDLASITTSSVTTIFRSFARMSLSDEEEADSDDYQAILDGITVLLSSTSGAPSQDKRNQIFGSRKASDMGIQALILNVVNLGKFLNYYGNVNSSGSKGQGSNSNACFINYTDPRAQTVIGGGAGGVCNSNTDGHPDLSFAPADLEQTKRRLCEGLMLVTNIMDILDNLDLSANSTMSKLEVIATQVETLRTAATTAGLGTLINMTSQSACETAMDTASSLNDMEYMYSLLFETGLQ